MPTARTGFSLAGYGILSYLAQLAGIEILPRMTYLAVGYGLAAVLVAALAGRRPRGA